MVHETWTETYGLLAITENGGQIPHGMIGQPNGQFPLTTTQRRSRTTFPPAVLCHPEPAPAVVPPLREVDPHVKSPRRKRLHDSRVTTRLRMHQLVGSVKARHPRFLPAILPRIRTTEMEATDKNAAIESSRSARSAAQESIQRALDQGAEQGQIHRLHQWATMLNELYHEDERDT